MSFNQTPQQLLSQSEVIYTTQQVADAIHGLALQITQDLQDQAPLVLTVMNGGLYFAGQLLPKLNFPLEQDYVQATRYQGGVEGKNIRWVHPPTQQIQGRVVLLLDDILDAGVTLAAVRDACLALGAVQVKVAVLTEKDLGQAKPIQADYVGLVVPNRYVFGCGMDVYGWWRNLPAIYALKA
jgi:hypoxanthine phosphoribosyltransferase